MLRKVRKKVAESISKVDEVEDFHFQTWLRPAITENIALGSIPSSVKKNPDIKYSFDEPDIFGEPVGLDVINLLPRQEKYFFDNVKSNKVFFSINPAELKEIDLSGMKPKPPETLPKMYEFGVLETSLKEFKVKFDSRLSASADFLFLTPEVVDCLSTMIPEVINIELLNVEKFIDKYQEVKVDQLNIDEFKIAKLKKIDIPSIKKSDKIYKVKVPGIGKYDSAVTKLKLDQIKPPKCYDKPGVKFPKISVIENKFTLPENISYKYFDTGDEDLKQAQDFKQKGYKNPKKIKDEVKAILNEIQKTEWKERKVQEFKLLPYEEEGAGFLAEHDRALLIDEFGLNKQRESLAALKFLFNNRVIKTALIIVGAGKAGNAELSRKCNLEIGWLGNLVKYFPEISFSEIAGDDNQRTAAWNKNAMVYVADHRTAANDYNLKILDQKKFKQFDCIIIDEAHAMINKGNKVAEFMNHINSRMLWAVTGLVDEKLKSDLNASLGKKMKIDSVKLRRKEDVKDKAPNFIWNENWVTLDDKQQQEYKETLVECQKDLRKVLETGNPYRFQANIFTLLHRLKQICNFGQGKTESPKAELLLEQVSMIRNNGKKVIVFSQYERLGIKSIEKLFEENGIAYILAPGGLSVDDMDKSVAKFKNDKEITAFITDAKISKLRFGNFAVPYIIKFDHWWNPITVWELQDLFDFKGKQKDFSINIYSYNVHNTIDQSVTELLSGKGLLNRNLMEMMQSKIFDDLVSVDEWLKFFNMVPSKEYAEVNPETMLQSLKKLSVNNFKTILTKLFNKAGYSKIDILDEPDKKSFSMVGEASRNGIGGYFTAKVLSEEIISVQTLSDVITKAGALQNKKLFIITKGSFEEECENIIPDSASLIDGLTLAKTLQGLNIQEIHQEEKSESSE